MENVVKEKIAFGEQQRKKDGKKSLKTNRRKEVIITCYRNGIAIIA
jgi:hypothetical protein